MTLVEPQLCEPAHKVPPEQRPDGGRVVVHRRCAGEVARLARQHAELIAGRLAIMVFLAGTASAVAVLELFESSFCGLLRSWVGWPCGVRPGSGLSRGCRWSRWGWPGRRDLRWHHLAAGANDRRPRLAGRR